MAPRSPSLEYGYTENLTPVNVSPDPFKATKYDASSVYPAPKPILYTSTVLSFLVLFQYGFSMGQLNLSTFNDEEDCDARPVVEGTCIMFPGHTKLQWTLAVNAWLFGCILGSFGVGPLCAKHGPKKSFYTNIFITIIAAGIQASSFSIWQFIFGRLLAGIATGISSGVQPGYVSEIAPPHLRNKLGMGYQCTLSVGILFTSTSFFYTNTNLGWRMLALVPAMTSVIFLLLAPFWMVESPAWLLVKGRRSEANDELARLFGEENVFTALEWLETAETEDDNTQSSDNNNYEYSADLMKPVTMEKKMTLSSPGVRAQLLTALGFIFLFHFSGINTIFYYSSSIFSQAGIKDDRIGVNIINVVNLIAPVSAIPFFGKFGNRRMMLFGTVGVTVSAVGVTISTIFGISFLTVFFAGLYAATFDMGMGVAMWAILPSLFPNEVRANAMGVSMGVNFIANFTVGFTFPYLSSALGDYTFLPFAVISALSFFYINTIVPDTAGKTNEEIQNWFRQKYYSSE